MKLKALALIALIAITTTVTAQTKKINTAKSSITWLAKKVTGKHEGTIGLKSGALVFKSKKLKGGTFTVDMATILATDVSGDAKTNLENHLKSEDFFGTEKYTTSKLVFTKIAAKANGLYTVTANLTIKDITNSIVFDITVDGNTAKANLKIDRTKYDIKYNSGSIFSGLGDKAISDEFELNVNLQF